MRKTALIIGFLFLSVLCYAQQPEKITFSKVQKAIPIVQIRELNQEMDLFPSDITDYETISIKFHITSTEIDDCTMGLLYQHIVKYKKAGVFMSDKRIQDPVVEKDWYWVHLVFHN